jgi:signal transduction histidine kinase
MLAGEPLRAADSTYLLDLVRAVGVSIASVSILGADQQERWSSEGVARLLPIRSVVAQRAPDNGRQVAADSARVDALSQTLAVDYPITAEGRRVGTLAARVRLSSVVQMDSLRVLAPGASLVIREGSQLLWASSSAVPYTADSTLAGEWEIVRRSVPGLALTLELVAPAAPFVRPFERAARTGLAVLSLVTLFAMLLTFAMTRRITRSLHALSSAATQVAQGELDVVVQVASNDEAGRLAAAFNRMTESLRQSLAELSHQRSLAAVGEFAASLSHEVRNSLTAVRVDLQHANRHLAPEHPGKPLVSRTLDSVRRLDATVTSALRVARGGHVRRAPVSLNEVLERAMSAATPAYMERGAILAPLPDESMPAVYGDAAALEALFLNLLLNAAQALNARGSASVSVARDNGNALITISDDGGGVPANQLASLGKTFHSTKESGTGLGLPIARRIAESHGGTLRIASENGNGTSVYVALPAMATISEGPQSPSDAIVAPT